MNRPATRANTDSNSPAHQPASATLPCPEQQSRPAQATISDWSSEPSTLKVWSMLPVEPPLRFISGADGFVRAGEMDAQVTPGRRGRS
ncbi:hypothetical protein ACWKT5_25175 [Streptomyces avermitilis]